MATRGIGFFDRKGHYFKTPVDATLSDLAGILGKVGEGESLAPGIAKTLLDRRHEIEKIFRDHDEMLAAPVEEPAAAISPANNIARLREAG
ncbi:MAG: hypothetical protein ACKOXK_04805 [Chakrabartia sp.]